MAGDEGSRRRRDEGGTRIAGTSDRRRKDEEQRPVQRQRTVSKRLARETGEGAEKRAGESEGPKKTGDRIKK